MPTAVLARLYQSRLDVLRSVIDELAQGSANGSPAASAELAHRGTEYRMAVRELAEAVLELPKVIERLYFHAWDSLIPDGGDFIATGEELFRKWDAGIALMRDARAVVAREAELTDPDTLDKIDAAIELVCRERQKADDRWPWFRKEDEAAVLAEHARGETIPNEVLLRELQDRLARGRQE